MIRFIIKCDNANMAANVGGHVLTTFQTFDFELDHIEKYLAEHTDTYSHAQVIGIEVLRSQTAVIDSK